MRVLLASAVVLGSMLGSCTSPKAAESPPSLPVPAETRAKAPVPSEEVLINLERTECYGWCPNYTVWIRGDGHVTYEGRSFVTTLGFREKEIQPAVVRELTGKFLAMHFFDLKDRYHQVVTDCSTTRLVLRIDDKIKTVANYWAGKASGPREPDLEIHEGLDQLAKAIDDAVDIESWIGTEAERKQTRRKFKMGWPGRTDLGD